MNIMYINLSMMFINLLIRTGSFIAMPVYFGAIQSGTYKFMVGLHNLKSIL